MPWLSHKNLDIKDRKIVRKGKPKTTKISVSRQFEGRENTKNQKKSKRRSRHPVRRKAVKGSVFHA